MTLERIAIFGTGLIGASVGLALRSRGFDGAVVGWDKDRSQVETAQARGAISEVVHDASAAAESAEAIVLAGPVFSILEWMERLAPLLKPHQLVTDVGSVKRPMVDLAAGLYGGEGQATYLPGHPMAGKEVSGAEHADADLFLNAVWLFTPDAETMHPAAVEWRNWVRRIGARTLDLDASRHDEICAWVSHMPQMLATALSALYEEHFGEAEDMRAIGGRALREMTRLGASPYSMWRDIAHTNADAIGGAIAAVEQRLAHLREQLKTPELREEFTLANAFRKGAPFR